MTCPACGGELVEGGARCPVCEAPVAPRVEGALAADPRLVTPPARSRVKPEATAGEPVREIPGLRREPPGARDAWREEVRNRVRSRRQKRADAGLPLFDRVADPTVEAPSAPAPVPPPAVAAPAPAADAGEVRLERDTSADRHAPAERSSPLPPAEEAPATPAAGLSATEASLTDADLVSPGLSEAELADLPLRAAVRPSAPPRENESAPALVDAALAAAMNDRPRTRAPRIPPVVPSLEDEILVGDTDGEPEITLEPPLAGPSPVERPARALERAQAAAFDMAVFVVLAAVVIYFAGRAARVDPTRLTAAWPWLASFLGLLAVFYAGYFTGTTGQTPGKLLTGLRVVGTSGRPPAYPRAAARAVTGFVGVFTAGAGLLPILFDPARRALHDRLFRTRVVRR